MTTRQRWTQEELLVAFNLYCKTPFGKIHNRNPEIVALASLIGRTPSAVSWKLANFASLDPSLKSRGIVGASHGGKMEKEIWDKFSNDWESLTFISEKLLAQFKGEPIEAALDIDVSNLPPGKERETIVRTRVNQTFFRKTILAAYNATCCITGLSIPELLNASHIVPWAADPHNRVNPRNGLCLNAIHDRAFDRGLLTITSDFKVRFASSLRAAERDEAAGHLLLKYEGTKIRLPDKFAPDPHFIEYHNQKIFQG